MERDDQNRGVVHAALSPSNIVGVQVVERCASTVERGDGVAEVGEMVQARLWIERDEIKGDEGDLDLNRWR
ncbi:hypothetical protein Q3G72_030862 [Acer saccharum]|nr:hypothetical protein Q3G72_030862 [Acer saccharum]